MSLQLMKVPFRVIFCSGEDPEFPVSNLVCDIETGWQTIRFSSYPQVLLLQFLTPDLTIKELKITSHQAKIPKSIEVFVCSLEDIHKETNKIKFKRIGEMKFSPNKEINPQRREVQVAHLNMKASYMKFVFHENHETPQNPFNQIGLIALCIKAEQQTFKSLSVNEKEKETTANSKIELPTFPDLNYSYKTLLTSLLDERSCRKYKSLEIEKRLAVENEDFDKAQRLKTQMDQLLFYGQYSNELQKKSQKALEEEDFDTLKILKAELQRMQNSLKSKLYQKGGLVLRQEIDSTKAAIKEGSKKMGISQQEFRKVEAPTYHSPQKVVKSLESPKNVKYEQENSIEMKFRDVSPIKKQPENEKDGQAILLESNQNHQINNIMNENLKNEKSLVNEEKKFPPVEEAADLMAEPFGNEDLTAEQKALCSPFLGLLGEEICFKLFHEKWQRRELGLLELEKRVLQDPDFKKSLIQGNSTLNLILRLFGILSRDKVIKIVIISLELLKKVLMEEAKKDKVIGNEFSGLDGLWEGLLERIGDNCLKINQLSREIFCILTKKAWVKQTNSGVQALVKELDKEKGKISLSIRHLEERLKLCLELISQGNLFPDNVLSSITNFSLRNIEHQKNTVRDLAFKVLDGFKSNYGEERARKILGDLPRKIEVKLFA